MKKFELHCHTLGGSCCAQCSAEKMIEDYAAKGFNGVVVTNHYGSWALSDGEYANKRTDKEKVDFFFSLVDHAKAEGEKRGMEIYFGIEVRISSTMTEYMLLGFDREFLYNNPRLYELTQKELFELCNKNGILIYQSHPYRMNVKAGDPRFLHGAEAFNGHFHHFNNNAVADDFCTKNNLIKLCGTDYHEFNQPISCYALVPDYVKDEKSLVKAIFNGETQNVCDEVNYQTEIKKYKESVGKN